MAITLRANKGTALTYEEMDTNFGSYFYSSSVDPSGQTLYLHYTGSIPANINQATHAVSLNKGIGTGGSDHRVPFYSGSTTLTSMPGFVASGSKVGINVNESTDLHNLTYQLEVSGSIRASQGILSNSDERLKINVRPIDNATEIVSSLTGVRYDWKEGGSDQVGVIAQEVEKVLPEVVSEDNNGYLSVDYPKLVSVLIQSNKELTERIERLESRLNDLD